MTPMTSFLPCAKARRLAAGPSAPARPRAFNRLRRDGLRTSRDIFFSLKLWYRDETPARHRARAVPVGLLAPMTGWVGKAGRSSAYERALPRGSAALVRRSR